MSNPPKTPPHSDVEGVNRDARIGDAEAAGSADDTADLERARRQNKGRPEYSDDRSTDDRAR